MLVFCITFVAIFIWLFSLPILFLTCIFWIPVGAFAFVSFATISFYIQWHHKDTIIINSFIRKSIQYLNLKRWFSNVSFVNKQDADFIIGHPHGILCCGMVVYHFESENTVFAVAPILFHIPIFGWLARHMALIPASKHMIKKALKENHKVILMVGGIEELLAHSQRKLYLQKRYGYVKIAKELKKSLIPVYTKGEYDTFYNPPLPFLTFRQWLSNMLGFGIMFPWVFGWYGLWLPKRIPLSLHFGSPVQSDECSLKELKHQYHRSLCQLMGSVYQETPQQIANRHGLSLPILSRVLHRSTNGLG